MRFVIDEMFSPDTASQLRDAGHDAVHLIDVRLDGSDDGTVLSWAVAQDRVLVTENARDFVPLLDRRIAAGKSVCAVVVALKKNLPREAARMTNALAQGLEAWAKDHREPFPHVHWLTAISLRPEQ